MNEGNFSPSPAPVPPSSGAAPVMPSPTAPPAPRPAPPTPATAPTPPWMQRSRTPAPPQPGAPLAFASAAPAPTPTQPVGLEESEEKNWGPLKPIRKVPKPSDAKAAYILAQTEHVVLPEEDASRRKTIIIGSIVGFLLIAGGSFAFIKYGRDVTTATTNSVQVVNTKVGNVNTSTVFPSASANINTAPNGNASSSVDSTKFISTTDTDSDRIPDEWETYLGTDPVLKDTDEDGYNDRSEVAGGYSPRSSKKIAVRGLLFFCDNFVKKNSTIFTTKQRETLCAKNGTVLQKVLDTPPPARFENVIQLEYNSQYDALQTWCEQQYPASTTDQNAAVRRTTCQYNNALIIPGMFQFLSLDEPISRSAPAI